MCRECDNELRRIADRYFGREQAVSARVRVGKPCEQIVAEATSGQAELILLSSPKCSPWKRWYGERTVEGVVRLAPCPTLVLPRIWKMTPEEARHAPRPADAMKSDWLTTAPA
jgi:nucleotide-binding universal stress UspA family protein